MVNFICPNQNSNEIYSRKIVGYGDKTTFSSPQSWDEFANSVKLCPHALKGKILKVGSFGTNPYVYTDFQRNVIFNEKGQPVGSNTEIAETLSKLFGFDIEIVLVKPGDFYDKKNQTWIGPAGDVSYFDTISISNWKHCLPVAHYGLKMRMSLFLMKRKFDKAHGVGYWSYRSYFRINLGISGNARFPQFLATYICTSFFDKNIFKLYSPCERNK